MENCHTEWTVFKIVSSSFMYNELFVVPTVLGNTDEFEFEINFDIIEGKISELIFSVRHPWTKKKNTGTRQVNVAHNHLFKP